MISARTSSWSGARLTRPRVTPRCQSEMCSSRIAPPLQASEDVGAGLLALGAAHRGLLDAGRKAREREPQRDRGGDERLVEHHRAWQEPGRPLAHLWGEEPV